MSAAYAFTIAIAIIGLLVGGVGSLASKRKDVVIDTLSKDNDATKAYNSTLESSVTKLQVERDGLQVRVNDYRALAQGVPQLKELSADFAKFAKEQIEQTKMLTKILEHQTLLIENDLKKRNK